MQSPSVRAKIAAIGRELGPEVLPRVIKLFDDEQKWIAQQYPATAVDLSYGPHPRHRLDIYRPQEDKRNPVPVLLFVHGGGFLRGDKGSADSWMNGHVGRMAARWGFIGAVMNYRLARDHTWPAGGEDVSSVIDWLKENVQQYGGDPKHLVLMGTSAGAVHISTYLQLNPGTRDASGLILLSGLYGITPLGPRDECYYGDNTQYLERQPLATVTETQIPLLVACAEFDPPRFQAEFVGLLQRRLDHHGHFPRSMILSGHNHYSLSMHLGLSDNRLSDEIIAFINEQCR